MVEIHPDNHPNDPFFPRTEYNQRKYVPLREMNIEKAEDLHQQGVKSLVEYNKEAYNWKRESYPAEPAGFYHDSQRILDEAVKRHQRIEDSQIEEICDQMELFMVFEGGEGGGKSTQIEKLARYLRKCKVPVFVTREPGGTPLGEKLRSVLLSGPEAPQSKEAELFMFAAARAEHMRTVIEPKLSEGYVVLCDRFTASTMAYQSYANGLDRDFVKYVNDRAANFRSPNVTFWLDIDPKIGLERAGRVDRTRFEDMTLEYHKNVRRGFVKEADHTWMKLDATRSIQKLHLMIRNRAFIMCQKYGYLPEKPGSK
jgi:dTMP kinase